MTRHDRAVSLVVDGEVLPGIHERASDFRQLPLQFARRHFLDMVSTFAYHVKEPLLTPPAAPIPGRSAWPDARAGSRPAAPGRPAKAALRQATSSREAVGRNPSPTTRLHQSR